MASAKKSWGEGGWWANTNPRGSNLILKIGKVNS